MVCLRSATDSGSMFLVLDGNFVVVEVETGAEAAEVAVDEAATEAFVTEVEVETGVGEVFCDAVPASATFDAGLLVEILLRRLVVCFKSPTFLFSFSSFSLSVMSVPGEEVCLFGCDISANKYLPSINNKAGKRNPNPFY